jgi:hypothetical protein
MGVQPRAHLVARPRVLQTVVVTIAQPAGLTSALWHKCEVPPRPLCGRVPRFRCYGARDSHHEMDLIPTGVRGNIAASAVTVGKAMSAIGPKQTS